MSSESVPAPAMSFPSVDGTMGCLFLSAIFTSVLWGVGNVQVYFYCESHAKTDKLWLKLYIFVAWALDTVHEILLLMGTYTYLVTDIGNPLALMGIEKSLADTPILLGIIDFQVQLLFVYRAWMLSNQNHLLAGILLVLISGQLSAVIVYFSQTYNVISFEVSMKYLPTVQALSAVTMFVDFTLASTLAFLLHRKKSGFNRSDSLVNRIMTYTIGTGMITVAFAMVALITSVTMPHYYIYVLMWELLPKLYFNCMLTSLNLRKSLRETGSGTNEFDFTNFSVRSTRLGIQKPDASLTNGSRGITFKDGKTPVYFEDRSPVNVKVERHTESANRNQGHSTTTFASQHSDAEAL